MHYSSEELHRMGFRQLGRNIKIHRSVILFGCEAISIASNVRIDCLSLISAGADGITIGHCVHIAAGCYLFGSGGQIAMQDFSGLSSRVSIYTASDDYSDGALTNPTVPDEFRNVETGPVVLEKHAIVGAGSVILPAVTLEIGCAVGALSIVKRSLKPFEILAGRRVIGHRPQSILDRESHFRDSPRGREIFLDDSAAENPIASEFESA